MRTQLLGGGYCHEPLLRRLPLDSSYVVSYCSPTRYCPFPFPLFSVPAPRAYCTGAYCHVHVYRTVPLLPGDLSFDLLSPGKPSCISLCTYFAQYIHLSPVLSVELCSSLYCSQSAGAPACLALGSSSSLDSSRNTRSKLPLQAPAPQPFTATFIPPPHFPFPTPGESELWRLPSP